MFVLNEIWFPETGVEKHLKTAAFEKNYYETALKKATILVNNFFKQFEQIQKPTITQLHSYIKENEFKITDKIFELSFQKLNLNINNNNEKNQDNNLPLNNKNNVLKIGNEVTYFDKILNDFVIAKIIKLYKEHDMYYISLRFKKNALDSNDKRRQETNKDYIDTKPELLSKLNLIKNNLKVLSTTSLIESIINEDLNYDSSLSKKEYIMLVQVMYILVSYKQDNYNINKVQINHNYLENIKEYEKEELPNKAEVEVHIEHTYNRFIEVYVKKFKETKYTNRAKVVQKEKDIFHSGFYKKYLELIKDNNILEDILNIPIKDDYLKAYENNGLTSLDHYNIKVLAGWATLLKLFTEYNNSDVAITDTIIKKVKELIHTKYFNKDEDGIDGQITDN